MVRRHGLDLRAARPLGGRAHLGRRRRTFIIRRQIGAKRYEVSTHCDRERPALAQLDRFLADPEAYDPRGGKGEPLRLTAELVRAFVKWSLAPAKEGGKGNSRAWVLQQKAYLAWWAQQPRGRDLRRLSLPNHVIPALDGVPGRKHRIETLKAFFSWLRKERRTERDFLGVRSRRRGGAAPHSNCAGARDRSYAPQYRPAGPCSGVCVERSSCRKDRPTRPLYE